MTSFYLERETRPLEQVVLTGAEAIEARRLSENGMTLVKLGAHFRKPYAAIAMALAQLEL